MGGERIRYIRSLQSLVPLHEHTQAIGLSDEGRVQIRTKLPAPTDELGIPRPERLTNDLLSLMDTPNYIWPGQFDEHHLATPKADFTVIRTSSEGDIGSAFRGLSCLKIEMPRQMHNFAHAVFELPGRPEVDVMRQAVLEVGQARRLQTILNEHLPTHHHEQSNQMKYFCMSAIHSALEHMREPEVGMMPPLESIYGMEIDELRLSLASILRVRRFSKKHLIHPAIRKAGQRPVAKVAA